MESQGQHWWGVMEGGGAMEGEGMVWSNGEGKLTWARRRPCSLVVIHACLSLLVSAHCCPRPFTFVGGRFRPHAVVFVHRLIRGCLSSHMPFSPHRSVNGWWCWAFAAACGAGPSSPFMAGGVVTALCRGQVVSSSLSSMGWPTHCMWHERLARLLSSVHHHPRAANKVSELGGR